MPNANSRVNRVVWVDVPVKDLGRAEAFYAGVLGIKVERQSMGSVTFAVFEHHDGSGGSLVPEPDKPSLGGVLVYFNVDGRIRDAVAHVTELGGSIEQPIHAIGPHGFRAVLVDSEGNRIAVHSSRDA